MCNSAGTARALCMQLCMTALAVATRTRQAKRRRRLCSQDPPQSCCARASSTTPTSLPITPRGRHPHQHLGLMHARPKVGLHLPHAAAHGIVCRLRPPSRRMLQQALHHGPLQPQQRLETALLSRERPRCSLCCRRGWGCAGGTEPGVSCRGGPAYTLPQGLSSEGKRLGKSGAGLHRQT